MAFKVYINPPDSTKMIARFTDKVIRCEAIRMAGGFVELYETQQDMDDKKPFLLVNRDIVLIAERVK